MKMINVIKTLFIGGILTVILFAVSTIELKADNPCPPRFIGNTQCNVQWNNGCCVYSHSEVHACVDFTDC